MVPVRIFVFLVYDVNWCISHGDDPERLLASLRRRHMRVDTAIEITCECKVKPNGLYYELFVDKLETCCTRLTNPLGHSVKESHD